MSFLQEKYQKEVVPALMEDFGYDNPMTVPKLEKVVVNMGLGDAVENPKIVDVAVEELRSITGQQPIVTRARRSIAAFKLREGMPIGAKVTLRGRRMFEFVERLIYVAIPRVRDFKGVSPKSFDGHGNYSLGVKEQIIFPEINYDNVDTIRGMNITMVSSAETDDEARRLLDFLGLPFRKSGSPS
ncbi:MAG: 50S ribosomal protein L5 [Myxococcota bacterium]